MRFDVDRFLSDKPLAITPAGLEELRAHVAGRIAAFEACPREFLASVAEDMRAATGRSRQTLGSGVGVIPIRGTISQHAQGDVSAFLFGGTATESVSEALREFLADDSIGRIVLDVDSPGGSTYGVAELASEIRAARRQKPVQAVANSVAASAALWIARSASEFYVTPGGMAGSVGVYALHMDYSRALDTAGITPTLIHAGRFKAEGSEYAPLSDEARAHIQETVDAVYQQFVSDLARGSGVSEARIRRDWGEGRLLTAQQAVAVGMADGVATLAQVLQRPPRAVADTVDEPSLPGDDVAAEASAEEDGATDEGLGLRVAALRLRARYARIPA